MSDGKSRLRIYSQTGLPTESTPDAAPQERRRIHFPRPHSTKPKEPLCFSDRLLRNSALACALLLGILALGNIDHPITRRASQSVERALNMHIDLDESIGSLTFVRELMPESALVFFNLSGEHELARPVSGELTHPYADSQPWLLFACPSDSAVFTPADGTVTAVSELSGGTYGILIDHGSGLESVCAYLSEVSVQPGETVSKGDKIGRSSASVYYELRENETAVDPTTRMGI